MAKQKRKDLALWNVILLNDDNNTLDKIIAAITHATNIPQEKAEAIAKEAHEKGRAVITTTHQEKAELFMETFLYHSPPISVEIEPIK